MSSTNRAEAQPVVRQSSFAINPLPPCVLLQQLCCKCFQLQVQKVPYFCLTLCGVLCLTSIAAAPNRCKLLLASAAPCL